MTEEAYDPKGEEILSTLDRVRARFHELTKRLNLLKTVALSGVLQSAANPNEGAPAIVAAPPETAEGTPDTGVAYRAFAGMWSADIFETETSKLIESRSFGTYHELVVWIAGLINNRPDLNFWASFQIPADATEGCRSVLETLGRTRTTLN